MSAAVIQQNPPARQSGASGYALARAQGKCHVCGIDITPGQKLIAALRESPAALDRLDVCGACWPGFDRHSLLGFWQMVMPQPNAKKQVFVDDDVLCELFERLADASEIEKINFRFVLGLILMRKRRLVYESSRLEDGKDIWSMRFRGREEKLDLLNPHLDEQHMAGVSAQLGEILSGDF